MPSMDRQVVATGPTKIDRKTSFPRKLFQALSSKKKISIAELDASGDEGSEADDGLPWIPETAPTLSKPRRRIPLERQRHSFSGLNTSSVNHRNWRKPDARLDRSLGTSTRRSRYPSLHSSLPSSPEDESWSMEPSDSSPITLSEALAIFKSSLEVDLLSPDSVENKEEEVEVFLGGSCGNSTWRKDIAIPVLEEEEVTYYNPQVDDWTPEMVKVEAQAKELAEVLLFVIDGSTRALASMSEVIEYICRGRRVVLVIQDISDGTNVAGDIVTGRELEDLNRARAYLRDCAGRHGVKVLSDVGSALEAVLRLLKEPTRRSNRSKNGKDFDDPLQDREDPTPLSPKRKMNISRRVSLRCAQRRTHEQKDYLKGRNFSVPGAGPKAPKDSLIADYTRADVRLFRRKNSGLRPSAKESFLAPPRRQLNRTETPPDEPVGIFLGGSCNPTTWRRDVAVPLLDPTGITYYNPQVATWTSDLIAKEAKAKEEAVVLLFVIDNATRATVSMGEATELICRGRNVVIVIQDILPGAIIDGTAIYGNQLSDLNRVRAYLRDIAQRHGIVVYTDIRSAVEAAIELYTFVTTETGAHPLDSDRR